MTPRAKGPVWAPHGDERRRKRKVIYLKACPKCHGDVKLETNHDGKYLECIQCSYTIDSREAARRATAASIESAA